MARLPQKRKGRTMAEKTTAKRVTKKADGGADVLAAIAAMGEHDRAIGERRHALGHRQRPGAGPVTRRWRRPG
jgi:hypothetical protein